jgi:hypothetical protein
MRTMDNKKEHWGLQTVIAARWWSDARFLYKIFDFIYYILYTIFLYARFFLTYHFTSCSEFISFYKRFSFSIPIYLLLCFLTACLSFTAEPQEKQKNFLL